MTATPSSALPPEGAPLNPAAVGQLSAHITATTQMLAEALHQRITFAARSLWPNAGMLVIRESPLAWRVRQVRDAKDAYVFDPDAQTMLQADRRALLPLNADVTLLVTIARDFPALGKPYQKLRDDDVDSVNVPYSRTLDLHGSPVSPLESAVPAPHWRMAPMGDSAALWVGDRFMGQVRHNGTVWTVLDQDYKPTWEVMYTSSEDRGVKRRLAQQRLMQVQGLYEPASADTVA